MLRRWRKCPKRRQSGSQNVSACPYSVVLGSEQRGADVAMVRDEYRAKADEFARKRAALEEDAAALTLGCKLPGAASGGYAMGKQSTAGAGAHKENNDPSRREAAASGAAAAGVGGRVSPSSVTSPSSQSRGGDGGEDNSWSFLTGVNVDGGGRGGGGGGRGGGGGGGGGGGDGDGDGGLGLHHSGHQTAGGAATEDGFETLRSRFSSAEPEALEEVRRAFETLRRDGAR
jgi:hypothetical protein